MLGGILVSSHGRVIVFDADGGDYAVIIIQMLEYDVSAHYNVIHVHIAESPKIFLIESNYCCNI